MKLGVVGCLIVVGMVGCGGGGRTANVVPPKPVPVTTQTPPPVTPPPVTPPPTGPPSEPPPPTEPPPVAPSPSVPEGSAVFVGPGSLGGLSIVGSDVLIAVTDNEVYDAASQTGTALHGVVSAMDATGNVLSLTDQNVVWLNGEVQGGIMTDLPPTLSKGEPVWFDSAGVVQTLEGPLYTPSEGQDGIDLQASGDLITWIEEENGGTTSEVYASYRRAAPNRISLENVFVSGATPLDSGGGRLFVVWGGDLEVAESRDEAGNWVVYQPLPAPGIRAGGFVPQIAVAANGTLYVVFQQRGNPETADDVMESWEAVRGVDGVWAPTVELEPVGLAEAGDWNPHVVADGSVSMWGLEEGAYLNGVRLAEHTTDIGQNGPLLGLLPDGARVLTWTDAEGVWFEAVPQ